MRILHKDGSYRLLSWLAVRDRELIMQAPGTSPI
jgi:hypothetical protein